MIFASFYRRRVTRTFCIVAAVLGVSFYGPGTVQANDAVVVPTVPQLRLETGMHTSQIRFISVDAANKCLVTGSYDKTVRVWNAQTGDLLQTLRVPIGEADEGEIDAVAISPDGKTIACGGYTGYQWDRSVCIYVFDRVTGHLLHRMTGLPDVIYGLVYSADGHYLAATLHAGGLRLYSAVDNYRLAGSDITYEHPAYGVDFAMVNGELRLATSCFDGSIRLYSIRSGTSALNLLTKVKAPLGNEPHRIQFSPDGTRLAVGYNDVPAVSVLSARDLSVLYNPDATGLSKGNLCCVSWTTDGKSLYATGEYTSTDYAILRWDKAGQGSRTELPGLDNVILAMLPRAKGGVFFGAGSPALGILDGVGERTLFQTSKIADFRNSTTTFGVSSSGSDIQFSYQAFGAAPAQFSWQDRRVTMGATSGALAVPLVAADGLDIQKWHSTQAPTLNGNLIQLKSYEESRSLAIASDHQRFLLGTEWNLRLFDNQGNLKWAVSSPGIAWEVNISGDGRTAIAGFSDGTIRWYRMTDGQELLAFFPHIDQKRWVAWTPTGYYDCSPGAEGLIGWHVNHGKDREADFFPVSKFRETYYRPDVLARILDTLDENTALAQANAATGRVTTTTTNAVLTSLPPVVTILSPQSGNTVASTDVTVTYEARTPDGDPVTSVKLLIDGNAVAGERKIQLVSAQGQAQTAHFTIPQDDCTLTVIAQNSHGFSSPANVKVHWQGKSDAFVIKPTLYILAVGVSNYQNKDLTLQYPAKDATDFVAAMKSQKGVLYQDVQVKLLINTDATRDNIVDGLEWIEKQTTQHDVAMVFLSGHGANDNSGNYLFIPDDFDVDHVRRTGLAFSDIRTSIANLAGKKLLFVDSCNSGNVMGHTRGIGMNDLTGAVNELSQAENGAVVFAASTGAQSALEEPDWHNGAFTKALVEALSGKADYGHNGKITVNMLDLYISQRVKELTQGRQTPTTTKPETVPDFPVAFVKE